MILFTPPKLERFREFNSSSHEDVETLKNEFLIEVVGNLDNLIRIDAKYNNIRPVTFIFNGHGNQVILGKPLRDKSELILHAAFHGNHSSLTICDMHYWPIDLFIDCYDDHQRVVWGEGSTSNGTKISCQSPQKQIIIGDDCMFASDSWIRNADMHGVYDISSRQKINQPGDVIIQPHVWVGQYAYILNSVTIGYGSIVGAQSLVKGKLDTCSIYAGSPAKRKKKNVTWDRGIESFLPQHVIDTIRNSQPSISRKPRQVSRYINLIRRSCGNLYQRLLRLSFGVSNNDR